MENKLFNNPKSNQAHPIDKNGRHLIYEYPNGYGASVVRFKINNIYGSYTNNDNEWELAVLHEGAICYDTPITNDVIGHLSEDEVEEILKRISALNTV